MFDQTGKSMRSKEKKTKMKNSATISARWQIYHPHRSNSSEEYRREMLIE